MKSSLWHSFYQLQLIRNEAVVFSKMPNFNDHRVHMYYAQHLI